MGTVIAATPSLNQPRSLKCSQDLQELIAADTWLIAKAAVRERPTRPPTISESKKPS